MHVFYDVDRNNYKVYVRLVCLYRIEITNIPFQLYKYCEMGETFVLSAFGITRYPLRVKLTLCKSIVYTGFNLINGRFFYIYLCDIINNKETRVKTFLIKQIN